MEGDKWLRVVAAALITIGGCSAAPPGLGMSGTTTTAPTTTGVRMVSTPPKAARGPATDPGSIPGTSTTTTTTTTTTLPPIDTTPGFDWSRLDAFVPPEPPSLDELVAVYFKPEDRAWALRVAFCESSAQPGHTGSKAVHRSSGAAGWFQHLPKFWPERSAAAGLPGADILDPVANVQVAAWLLYETPQGKSHWYPSEHCWKETA